MTEAPAIFLLANDRVLANVVQLLHSLRVHGFSNNLFFIPFNEEIHFLKKVSRVFGIDIYNTLSRVSMRSAVGSTIRIRRPNRIRIVSASCGNYHF